jgi:integrase
VAALRRYKREQAERLLRIGVRQTEDGFVVTDPLGEQMRPQALSAAFRSFAVANGFDITRYHSLRHSAAVMMLASGVDVKTTSARLGHSDPALLFKTYSHRTDDADRAAAARLEVVLGP